MCSKEVDFTHSFYFTVKNVYENFKTRVADAVNLRDTLKNISSFYAFLQIFAAYGTSQFINYILHPTNLDYSEEELQWIGFPEEELWFANVIAILPLLTACCVLVMISTKAVQWIIPVTFFMFWSVVLIIAREYWLMGREEIKMKDIDIVLYVQFSSTVVGILFHSLSFFVND